MDDQESIAENPRAVIGNNQPPFSLEETVANLPSALERDHADLQAKVDAIAARANAFKPKSDKNPNGGRSVDGPADVEIAKQIILDAKALSTSAKEAHGKEKKPYLDGGRIVDEHFRAHAQRLAAISEYSDGCIRLYQDKIEAAERARLAAEAERKRQEEERQREIARKAEEDGRIAAAAKATQKADNAAASSEAAKVALEQASDARTAGDAFAGVSGRKSWTAKVLKIDDIDLNKLKPWISAKEIEKAAQAYAKRYGDAEPLAGVSITEVRSNTYRSQSARRA